MICSLRINVQRGQYCNNMRLMNSERFFAWPLFSIKKTNPVWNDTIISHWVKLSTKYTHRNNLQYSFPCFVRAQSASCCAPAPLLPEYYWFLRDHLKTNLFLTITEIRAAKHLPVYNFLAWKGPSFCDRVCLNFSAFAQRGILLAAGK